MDFSLLFIIILITYTGSVISKILYYVANVKSKEKINALFLSIPFSSLRTNSYFEKNDFISKNKNLTVFAIEFIGMLSFLVCTLSIINLMMFYMSSTSETIVLILINIFFISGLIYFSIHDILRLKLPLDQTKIFLLSVVIVNSVIALYKFITFRTTGENVLLSISLGQFDNLIAGLVLGAIVFIFIKINKSFGIVDAYLMCTVGLMLGIANSLVLLITISFIGSIISVIYCVRIKKIRNVLVPFAPIILLSYVLVLGFGQNFILWLQNI